MLGSKPCCVGSGVGGVTKGICHHILILITERSNKSCEPQDINNNTGFGRALANLWQLFIGWRKFPLDSTQTSYFQ